MPQVCATCGFPLGDKMLPFVEKWERVMKNPRLDEKTKQGLRGEILDEIGIPKKNYCCRMRVISTVPVEDKMAFRR